MKIAPATRFGAAAASLVAPLLLAGCGGDDSAGSGRPTVVASFYALQYVAERVAGEHADIVNLTSPGQEPHDLELSIKASAKVADADLVVYEKGFQSAVDDAVESSGPDEVVDAAEVVDLLHAGESEAEHEEHAGEEEDGDGHGDLDPHFWLDPQRLSKVAAAVAAKLEAVDPDNAASYRDNLVRLESDLDGLDESFTTGLQTCALKTIVVSHDAFGYLGARFGLEVHGINGLSPDAEPSPAHIKELHDLIEHDGITTVFSEELVSPELARALADDLGLGTAVLDPIEGLSDDTANEDYLSLMGKNLEALRTANSCT